MHLFSGWHNAALISTQTRGCCTNNRTEMNLMAGSGEVTGCLTSARREESVLAASLRDRVLAGCIPAEKGGISRLHPSCIGELPRVHPQLTQQLAQESKWAFPSCPCN